MHTGTCNSVCLQRRRTQVRSLGISSGVGNGNPLQYSCLENPKDRGAWRVTVVCGVAELDKTERLTGEGNGTPSSTLAWKIPWTEETGSLRVGHD